jgi:hypothetical protein
MPTLQKVFLVLLYQFGDGVEFRPAESAPFFQGHGIKPKLRSLAFSLYVDMWRLRSIDRHKEESIRAFPKHG